MPDLSLIYHITREDYIAAQRAHQRRNRSGRIQYALGMILFGWFVFLAIFSLIFTPRVWVNYAAPLVLAAGYLYIYYFAHRLAYRRNASLFSDIGVDVTDEGLRIVTPHSDATVKWSRYQRWVESDKVFLLYMAVRTFNIIPKRVLTPEQQSSLRAILERNLPPDPARK